MDMNEATKYKKRTILTGYFNKNLACDACIARGGSEFKNIFQPIYLTTIQTEKEKNRLYADIEVEKNYCYDCAVKELEKELNEIKESWEQREGEREIKIETPSNPEPLQCDKCRIKGVEFRRYNGISYCLDCLKNYVLKNHNY